MPKTIALHLTTDGKTISGTVDAKLYSVKGDYCTHKKMGGSNNEPIDFDEYTVTHRPSLLSICHKVLLKDARAIMGQLAELDFVWVHKEDLSVDQKETIRQTCW